MEKDQIEMNYVSNDEEKTHHHHHHHHHHSHSSHHSHRKHKYRNGRSSAGEAAQYSKTKTVKLWKRILFTGVGVVIIGALVVMLFSPHDSEQEGWGTIFNIVHEEK